MNFPTFPSVRASLCNCTSGSKNKGNICIYPRKGGENGTYFKSNCLIPGIIEGSSINQ